MTVLACFIVSKKDPLPYNIIIISLRPWRLNKILISNDTKKPTDVTSIGFYQTIETTGLESFSWLKCVLQLLTDRNSFRLPDDLHHI